MVNNNRGLATLGGFRTYKQGGKNSTYERRPVHETTAIEHSKAGDRSMIELQKHILKLIERILK